MAVSESPETGFCGSKTNAMSVRDGVIQNECFVDVLNIIPHALLALICIFILTVWNHSVIGKLKVKTWVHFQGHSLRWICTIALLTTIIVEIAEGFMSDLNDPDSTNYHAFIPACMAFLGGILSIIFYHNVEQWNSPKFLLLLLMYWPMAVVLKCLKALSIYRNNLTLDHLKVWLALIDIVFYLLLFLVELNVLRCQRYSFFKKRRRLRPPSDLENTHYLQSYVNFISQAVYWWVTDLLIKGFKCPLTLKDLGKLPASERSSRIYKKLQIIFKEEKFKAAQKNKRPSLMRGLFRATWHMLLLSALLRLIGDCLAFVGPLMVERIVNYSYEVNDGMLPSENDTKPAKVLFVTVDQFFWNGYVLSVVLFLALILQHTLLQNHHFLVIREGIRVRTAVQTMIYSKALKISTLELNNGISSVGQVINHMCIDSTFLMFFFFFVHNIWAVPVQVGLALMIIYLKLGPAGLIGGLFVICVGPIMYLLGLAMSKMQQKNMVYSDKRSKKVNELFQGIEVIKLMSWENGFLNSIQEVRSLELSYLLPSIILKGLMSFLGISTPVLGTLLAFSLHSFFEDTLLTAGATMAVLALFNLLQGPLQLTSLLFASVVHARVSSERLLLFLLASEVTKSVDSSPSLTKSCSGNLDSSAPSCHNIVDKIDSVTSVDGKNPISSTSSEHQPVEKERTRRNSVTSYSSAKLLTPQHPKTHLRQHSESSKGGSLSGLTMSASVGSETGYLEPKRKDLSRNATSSELLDVKPTNTLIRKSSAPALAVSEVTGDYKRRRHYSQWSVEEDDAIMEDPVQEQHYTIDVQGGYFSWDLTKEVIALADITLKIPSGKLTVVVGPAGSGKSSLLSAFLGEMMQVSGNVFRTRNLGVAYVSQRPWLLNATIKDNILFGKPFAWKRYKHVIAACALHSDIEQLPAADNTELGDKGLILTDGQKQRVCIARALYSDADTLLLDEPFSPISNHIDKHVMEEAIVKRMLKRNRTIILATSQVQYLSHAQQVVVMANGRIHFQGKVGEVKKFDPELYEVWRKAIRDVKASEFTPKYEGNSMLNLECKHSGGSQATHETLSSRASSSQSQLSVYFAPMGARKVSAMSVMSEASNEDAVEGSIMGEANSNGEVKTTPVPEIIPEEEEKLVKQETREMGAVKTFVYLQYLQACTITLCLVSFFLHMVYQCLSVSSNFWLALWATNSSIYARNMQRLGLVLGNTTYDAEFDNTTYLPIFIYLSVGAVMASFVSCLVIYLAGYVSCKNLFMNMLVSVAHLPKRFFDSNLTGRMLNRFSVDTVAIDQRLGGHIENLLRCSLFTLSAVVVNAVTTPYFLIFAVPFFIVFYFLQRFFRTTARALQRLDSVTKSPVFSHLSESLNGLTVIRAFGVRRVFQWVFNLCMKYLLPSGTSEFADNSTLLNVETDFKRRAFKTIDSNVTPFLFIHTTNRWLGICLDFMSCLLVFVSSVASLSSGLHGPANPAFVGLCIIYALMVSSQLNWIVRISTEVELSMNAVERVLEYTAMEKEPSITNAGPVAVAESWPSSGKIYFNNVSVRYAQDLDPVLHGVFLTIEEGEKIGVCGRSGSGKTSLMLALFRMLEITEGSICISDLDITRVDIHTLRSRLSAIPKEPVLFSGTLRFNLDTNKKRCDDKIWSTLEAVHLKDMVMALPNQLDTEIDEGGQNFNVDQRQLLCVARALLRDSMIVVMDDITALVDKETETLIQAVISSKAMENKTIITITHQPSFVMNYDRVIVLEKGKLKEFAPPKELMSNEASIFFNLVQSEIHFENKR